MKRFVPFGSPLFVGGLLVLGALAMASGCGSGGGDPVDASGGSGGDAGPSGGTGSGGDGSGGDGSGGDGSGGGSSGGAGPSGGGSAPSGGDGAGAFAGEGGQGEGGEAGGSQVFTDPGCSSTTEISAGKNYGDYSVFAVRLDLSVAAGVYSIRLRSGDEGLAAVFQGEALVGTYSYDPTASLADGEEVTVSFPGLFEIDLRSTTEADLRALDASIFDGCHTITIAEAPVITEGAEYGAFQLSDLVIDDQAEPGVYTFYAASGNSGQVELLRDGVSIATLDYDWMTTIGGGMTFQFDFPGTVSFTIGRPMGTSNLFALADLLFDGRGRLIVD